MMEMQTHVILEKPDQEQEVVSSEHLEALDETCRILNGLKLCTRYCVACQIACSIAEVAMPSEKGAGTWSPSPVVVRGR